MLYSIAADVIVAIHFAFVFFVPFGALLALKWHWIPWLHLPAAAWGLFIELTGRDCPLTDFENALRSSAGESGYAGGFIDPLKSETTLVVTAADAQHTSFGCGSESDFTYFGKAYFDQALRRHVSFTDAFEDARNIIQTRERGEGKTASNPQIYIGSAIQQKLRAFEKQLQANQ